jgi:hypothetical protein
MPRFGLLAILGFLAVAAIAVFAWRATHSAPKELLPISLPEEAGWVDIRLPVTDVSCKSKGVCRITALGLYQDQPAGITIDTADIGPSSSVSHPLPIPRKATPGGIVLESQGEPTLNLLRMLSSLYQHPVASFDLPKELKLSALTLEGNPKEIETAPIKFRVLYHDDQPDNPDYFEMYINPDLAHGFVEFAEKDQGYRLPILRAFGGKIQ